MNYNFHKVGEWFKDKEPLIWAAKNKVERDHRLKWLSEGCLHYHLSKFRTALPPCKWEIELFQQFKREYETGETQLEAASKVLQHVAAQMKDLADQSRAEALEFAAFEKYEGASRSMNQAAAYDYMALKTLSLAMSQETIKDILCPKETIS